MFHYGVQNWTGEQWVTIAQFVRSIDAQNFASAMECSTDHYRVIHL